MEPFAHRAWKPPSSSSIAEEERLVSLHARCSLRSLRLALVSRCLPHSLAGSLARPGQRRASLAQHGGARFPTLAAISGAVPASRLKAAFFVLDRRGRTPRLLVLSTAARDFRRSRQFLEPFLHRAWKPPSSSSIAEEERLVSSSSVRRREIGRASSRARLQVLAGE